MKVAAKVLGVFVALLFVIAVIPAFIPDEEYTAGAEQWLNDANNPEQLPIEVNRFNAIIGFNVDADKDMVVEGAKLIAEFNEQISRPVHNNIDTVDLSDYLMNPSLSASKKLSSSTSEAFKENPAQWLLANHDNYNILLNSNKVLIKRFRKIMTMTQYSHTMVLDINTPFVSYNNFLAIKRLNNLSIIDKFNNKDKQNAIKDLKNSISSSRLMMKQSVMLLDKMIAAELLKIDLLTYSSILDISPIDDKAKFVITNLTADEKDMLNAFKGEFAFLSTSLDLKSSDNSGVFSVDQGLFENFLIKQYLKRKRLENNAYKNIWFPMLELEKYSLALRKVKAEPISEYDLTWWEIYQDPIGYILLAIATPSYSSYMDVMDHADATITLLNLKTSIYTNKISPDRVEKFISSENAAMNTAYTGAKFSWNKGARELSYVIPDYNDEMIPRIKLYIKRKK